MMIDGYIRFVIAFVIITLLLYSPVIFVLKKRGIGVVRQLSYLSLFFSAALVIFLAIILFNLPFDFKPEQYMLNLIPFKRFSEENINIPKTITAELIPNVLMFIPLGAFIPIVFKTRRKMKNTALAIFFITLSIEFFQYFIGRNSDIDDIVTNLSGGIIGYGMFKLFNYLFKDKTWWKRLIGTDGSGTESLDGSADRIHCT